jgi:uncharacterized protein YciW
MKKLVLALIIVGVSEPADACHIYRVWHYPKPQRCFTALAPEQIRNRGQRVSALHQHVSALVNVPQERIEIPLPALDWINCPPGDERMRGIAFLRALGDGPAQR